MLAFQAPPEAVTIPVTRKGKIPGRMSLRQRCHPPMPKTLAASFRSVGIAMAPAITLNSMYHCVPSSNKTMEPNPSPPPRRIRTSNTTGNKAVAGTEAAICASGWAIRASLGLNSDGDDDPRFRSLLDTTLEIVEEEVGTLRRLVGDFSSFARLPHAELKDADLGEFLRECSQQSAALEDAVDEEAAPESMLGHDVEVAWDVPAEPLPAAIDRQMLRRVLVNLVRNGVQGHPRRAEAEGQRQGPGSARARARQRAEGRRLARHRRGGRRAGHPNRRERVFDPYFATKVDGTGLGLRDRQEIVVEHGGSIDAGVSERLGGARFVIRLPGARTLALATAREALERASLKDVTELAAPSAR